MAAELEIRASWERLDEGSAEERASFGMFKIARGNILLSEGHDFFVNRLRAGPLVATCYAAQWFAWNWWRLRWEPRTHASDWPFAHTIASIGEGYLWPNVTIFSDGFRTSLIGRPSSRSDAKPFRFMSNVAFVVPSTAFESAVDAFLNQVISQLDAEAIGETDLHRLWRGVVADRSAPDIARRRRLEALLGRDPDEADEREIQSLLADMRRLGEAGVAELAANRGHGGELFTADALRALASGDLAFSASPRDAAVLRAGARPEWGPDTPAWRIGTEAARALRDQEGLRREPIGNERLAQLAGTSSTALTRASAGAAISFVLDDDSNAGRLVLRSKWETGRRFELARLIGDRATSVSAERFFPATRSYTYRQKIQRAFAAEFLSPFERVDEILAGDYSVESQQDVAGHFNVSPITIRTLLVNNRRLERESLDEDIETETVAA